MIGSFPMRPHGFRAGRRRDGPSPPVRRSRIVSPSKVNVIAMGTALKGTVHGRVVELDQEVGRLDGQRVSVLLDPIEDAAGSTSETAEAWRAWLARGPDGPIEDADPSFP